MKENEVSNSDKFKHGICYFPFGGIVLFFTENNKSKKLMKHIKYSSFLLFVFMFLNFLVVGFFMTRGVAGIFFVIYAGITGFLGWKAYNGEDVQLDYIDNFEKKIKDNMNDDTVSGTTNSKDEKHSKSNNNKQGKKEDNRNLDDDILDF